MNKAQQHKLPETLKLENYMANFYCTERYYKNPLVGYLYTDGVRAFAEKAGAYWFLQELNKPIKDIVNDYFVSITLTSKNNKGVISIKGSDRRIIYTKNIPYTDCPEGEWLFFYDKEANVLIWNQEN